MSANDRRQFINKTGKLIIAAALGGIAIASTNVSAGLKFEMSSLVEGKCATCKYWCEIRKLSKDGRNSKCSKLGLL